MVTAEDPAGPWSDPVVMEGVERIDPSLFWDDDGSPWLCANGLPTLKGPDASNREIWLTRLDSETLQPTGDRIPLWQGALRGCSTPEACGSMCFTGAFAALYACRDSPGPPAWMDVGRVYLGKRRAKRAE